MKSLIICAAAVGLETACAGTAVKQRFAELQFPTFSLSLRGWFIVGGMYYAACFFVLYRILLHEPGKLFRKQAISRIILLMITNALWNLAFFRYAQLLIAFVLVILYSFIALGLLAALCRLDKPASGVVALYLAYLLYATTWAFEVWRLNLRA